MKKRWGGALVVGAFLAAMVPATMASAAESDAKASCKGEGWKALVRQDGTAFRNQGDCVSYAARGGVPVLPAPPDPLRVLCETNGGTYYPDWPTDDVVQACTGDGWFSLMPHPELCASQVMWHFDVDKAGCVA